MKANGRLLNGIDAKKKLFVFLFLAVLNSLTVKAQQAGELWGMTSSGGQNSLGTIFKTAKDGTSLSVQNYFSTQFPGASPAFCQPTLASNGKYYGTTYTGGTYNYGVLYEYDLTTDVYTKKFDFDWFVTGGYYTSSTLIEVNGKLYGTMGQGGVNGVGVLFEFDFATGTYTKKLDFSATPSGSGPFGGLTLATNGKLYGTTNNGGTSGNGVLFEYDPASNTFTKEFDFDGTINGANPYGNLTQASNGKLYGMTFGGGSNGKGVLFEFDVNSHAYTKDLDFNGANGANAFGDGLLQVAGGKMYGMTYQGGANNAGVLFAFDPSDNSFSKKMDFNKSSTGGNPVCTLIQADDGMLYGVTYTGGANNAGVLFAYDPIADAYVKKFDFDGVIRGALPSGNLGKTSGGKLLGVSAAGGINAGGVLFVYDPANNAYTKKLDFNGAINGSNPYSGFVQHTNGKLYGMTRMGGTNGLGVIFEYDASTLTYTKKFNFDGALHGSFPQGGLTLASNGNLYGVTTQGGPNDEGVLFEFDPITNTYVKKLDFNSSGFFPVGDLVEASNGKLYGMTNHGGAADLGVLFEYDPSTATISSRVDFNGAANGATPYNSLTKASDGKLYGMTSAGGSNGQGVLFYYDISSHTITKKVDFTISGTFGYDPYGGLIQGPNGNFYGMTASSDINHGGNGLLFRYDPSSNGIIEEFNFAAWGGVNPRGNLTLTSNGKMMGVTYGGGTGGVGTIFEFDPVTHVTTRKSDLTLADGANSQYGQLLVLRNKQEITFDALSTKTYGDAPFPLSASAGSGLPVTFTSSDTTAATVSGNSVTILKAGTITITARQGGDTTYLPASNVAQIFTIEKKGQTITFDAIATKTQGDAPFTLADNASSGLAISYGSSSGKATVNGNLITLVLAGRDTITASQPGNDFYAAAATESQTFCINPAKPVITVSHDGTGSPVLTSSAAVGNQWYLDSTAIAGQTATTITLVQSGSYKVQAIVDDCVGNFSDDVVEVVMGDLKSMTEPLSLYPNPSNDFIVLSGSVGGITDVSVVDVLGRSTSLKFEKQQDKATADVRLLPSGVYIIRVSTLNGFRQLKLIKQ